MSRTLLRSNTLVLWLSLSAALAASALSVGCSSSSDSGVAASGGNGTGHGGAAAHAGSESGSSDAGEPSTDGESGAPSGEGGRQDEAPVVGGGGGSGSVAGGSNGSEAGSSGEPGAPGGAGGAPGDDPGEPGAAGSPDMGDPEVAAAQARAVTLINGLGKLRKCTACHDVDYKGSGFFPNITPDVETGIGSWADEDIKVAIREGKDKDGETLCATMERYTFTDDQVADLVVYLRHLKPIAKAITKKCTTP